MTKRTTDEWTEDFYAAFAKDVDVHINMFTELKGEEAYTLRRMIMISLRGGPCSADKMTERIDELEKKLKVAEEQARMFRGLIR